ncbi:hypothetical protein CYMTET_27606, partial [Cymbomonas tetramitiformis]
LMPFRVGGMMAERFHDAVSLCSSVLADVKELFGDQHLETSVDYNNLAWLKKRQTLYAEAKPLYEKTLEIQIQFHGAHSRAASNTMNNLGFVLSVLGDMDDAMELFQGSLAIVRERVGNMHKDVAWSLNNIGVLLSMSGKTAKAIEHIKESLEIYRQILGEGHPDVAFSLNNLGQLYCTLEQYSEATQMYRQALAIRENKHGPSHIDVAQTLMHLGRSLRICGEHNEAELSLQRVIDIYTERYGPTHPEMSTALLEMGGLMSNTGRYEAALDFMQRSYAIRHVAYGPSHNRTESAKNAVAYVKCCLGMASESVSSLTIQSTIKELALDASKKRGGDPPAEDESPKRNPDAGAKFIHREGPAAPGAGPVPALRLGSVTLTSPRVDDGAETGRDFRKLLSPTNLVGGTFRRLGTARGELPPLLSCRMPGRYKEIEPLEEGTSPRLRKRAHLEVPISPPGHGGSGPMPLQERPPNSSKLQNRRQFSALDSPASASQPAFHRHRNSSSMLKYTEISPTPATTEVVTLEPLTAENVRESSRSTPPASPRTSEQERGGFLPVAHSSFPRSIAKEAQAAIMRIAGAKEHTEAMPSPQEVLKLPSISPMHLDLRRRVPSARITLSSPLSGSGEKIAPSLCSEEDRPTG